MGDERRPSGPVNRRVPPGDNRERLVCDDCGFVHYSNPRVVVGAVCTWDDRILLCRRAIPPRKGFWTLPAGFLEERETAEHGARREAWEEARARIAIDALLAVYSLTHVSEVQLFYRAQLLDPNVAAGEESLEVGLFTWEDIPWADLAFPSVRWALEHHRQVLGQAKFPTFGNPADAPSGTPRAPDPEP